VVDDVDVVGALLEARQRASAYAQGADRLEDERDAAVMAARRAGASLREIGQAIGMSGAGVHKLIARRGQGRDCAAA
jgi:DNA-directed RNA polymerase specialized sigma24 family protein